MDSLKGPVSFIGKPFTKELVSEYISYNPKTGFFNRLKTSGTKKPGDSVGFQIGRYLQLCICGKVIRGHRLAWFLTYGYLPKAIDHINGDGLDNRLCNLREVTQQQNNQNHRKPPKHNTSGFLGVSFFKAGNKFAAHINVDGKKKHLGYFDDPQKAHQMYLTVKRNIHSSCSI